jgi:hypothetical protein
MIDWMADVDLQRRWKVSWALLERARRALPVASEPRSDEYSALLLQYLECLEHNELELALSALDKLGHIASCQPSFWQDLENAAENIGLAKGCRLSAKIR